MIKVRFNDSTKFLTCEFSRISDHVVTLGNCKERNIIGFTTYRLSGEQLGDFSDYTTIYRILDDAVQYSNDGSVYVDPQPKPTPTHVFAARNILKDECFVIYGQMYKALCNIPNGGEVITGQNAVETNLEQQLNELAERETK